MKRATDRKNGRKLLDLREKALRRGEKLANTLRKLVAKGDPSDTPTQSFLRELEQALERLRQPLGQNDSPKPASRGRGTESRARGTGAERSRSSKPRSRRDRPQPAPAAAE